MVIPREAGRITYSTEIRSLKKRLSLNGYQRSVVIGTLLGDANLTANWSKTNFSLQIAHSIKQKDYVVWKYEVLKDWFLSPPRFYARNQSLTIKWMTETLSRETGRYMDTILILSHSVKKRIKAYLKHYPKRMG